jgi:hypothetical protein
MLVHILIRMDPGLFYINSYDIDIYSTGKKGTKYEIWKKDILVYLNHFQAHTFGEF